MSIVNGIKGLIKKNGGSAEGNMSIAKSLKELIVLKGGSVNGITTIEDAVKTLSELEGGGGSAKVKSLAYAFYYGGMLNEMTLSEAQALLDALDFSSVTNCAHMFEHYPTMTADYRPNPDAFEAIGYAIAKLPSAVTNMSYMFANITGPSVNLDLSEMDTSGATDMSYMFSGVAGGAITIDVSKMNVSTVTNMEGMFKGCGGATTVLDFSGWDTSNVTSMEGMLENFGQNGVSQKMWCPSTFVGTGVTGSSANYLRPFYKEPSASITVYTDLADADAAFNAGWGLGVASSKFTFVYGATHDDFLNA